MPRGSLDLTEETIKEFREAFALFVRLEGEAAGVLGCHQCDMSA